MSKQHERSCLNLLVSVMTMSPWSIFFHSIYIAHPSSSLHSLLPPPQDHDLFARLRAPTKFPRIPTRTKISLVRVIRHFPLSNIDSIFTSITRLYTPSSIVTLVHVYVVVKSFYFSVFQLLLSMHVSIYPPGYNIQSNCHCHCQVESAIED